MAVLLLLTLPSVFQPPPPQSSPPQRQPLPRLAGPVRVSPLAAFRHDLGAGIRWTRQHAEIRDLTIAVGVISAMDAAWFAVLVLYVIQILHQKPGAYGLLLAVAAIGGIAAGGTGARLTQRLGPWPSILAAGLTMAAAQTVLGLTANVFIAAVMLLAGSAAFAVFNMTAVTMRQRLVPPRLLGRVTSLYAAVAGGGEALGAIAGGALATAAGIRAPMLAGAAPIAVVTAVLAWRHRPARTIRQAPPPG